MVRYLAALLVILHVVSSQVPSTCSTCNRDKAALIGKVTCDKEGRLTTECSKGPIQMKVDGKYYAFNRITCIEGEWFGTSCSGIAVYLSKVLPDSTCPDVDFPEVNLPGSNCTIRPIGLPDIYDQNFVEFPWEWQMPGMYECRDHYEWQRFRKSETRSEIQTYDDNGAMYMRHDEQLIKLELNTLSCDLNTATGKYQLIAWLESAFVFLPSNQVECIYTKCPRFLSYNKANGRCEPINPNVCGYALVYESTGPDFANSYPLFRDATTNIPSNCTYIVAFPGCKISVFGSKLFANSDKKIPLVTEQYSGLWAIYSFEKERPYNGHYNFTSFNLPTSVVCESDKTSKSAPVLMTDLGVYDYTISHESRYLSMPIGQSAPFDLSYWNKALEPGLSFSLFGSGSGVLNAMFGAYRNFIMTFDFTAKKLLYNFTRITPAVNGERKLLINSQNFHVRFLIVELDLLEVYVNGRYVFSYSDKRWDFTSYLITQSNVLVEKCDFFVPKKCGKDHRFSAKTGDCEWTGSSSVCALVTDGGLITPWTYKYIESTKMPEDFKFKTNFIDVRQGCIAYAYTHNYRHSVNGDSVLNHWRGRYNYPNYQSGTCSQLEAGLQNLECFCDDYNKNPGHQGEEVIDADWLTESKVDDVTVGDNFVFTAILKETIPMAQIQLLGPSGIMPLVLFIADGKLLADNVPVKDGCFENYQVMAENFPVKKGDRFECRIRTALTGFEIYVNGALVMVYPYRNGFDGYGNFGKIGTTRFVNGLTLLNYRSDREEGYMGSIQNNPLFKDEPLLFGEFFHVNGMSKGAFKVELNFWDVEEMTGGIITQFVLEADAQHKVVQRVTTKTGVKTLTSSCSIVAGVEFDIVFLNKPHSMEVYINGELLPVLGENIQHPASGYNNVYVHGDDPVLFLVRKGPKRITNSPLWGS